MTQLTTVAVSQTRRPMSTVLAAEEEIVACPKEKVSWYGNRAYKRVSKRDVDNESNIIGCQLICHHKPDGTLKMRFVRWGRKDAENDSVRGDTLSLNLDALCLIISIAAQRSWTVKGVNVKAAYHQTRGFSRNI